MPCDCSYSRHIVRLIQKDQDGGGRTMDFKNVIWITGDQNCTAPIFRREFSIRSVKEAKISICGLGFFELYLNGKKVSDDLFVPVWTNYEKRENRRLLYPLQDELSNYRTYYLEYDVSSYLNEGVNTIGVMLGNGWYHQVRRTEEGDLDYGFPKLCFELLITDQAGQTLQFYSDSEMKWSESEILENNLFFGELHDLRKKQDGWMLSGFDDSAWKPACQVPAPETNFYRQNCPADKIIRSVTPQLVYTEKDRRIYDCGENITGFVSVRCLVSSGKCIFRIFYSL